MATDAELYQKALAKLGDPDKAAAFVAKYRESKGAAPAVPTPQRRMASADKPTGGPVGTVTKQSVTPAKEPAVLPPGDAYMPSPGAARMEEGKLASTIGAWRERNPVSAAVKDVGRYVRRDIAEGRADQERRKSAILGAVVPDRFPAADAYMDTPPARQPAGERPLKPAEMRAALVAAGVKVPENAPDEKIIAVYKASKAEAAAAQ